VIRRTIQYGTAHYPALSREGQFDRCVEHLQRKYAEGGYLRLWIPESDNARKLAELRALIHDTARLREAFGRIYEEVYRS
ncbi:phosphohydrolase, partial [Alistipes onderdonkii]